METSTPFKLWYRVTNEIPSSPIDKVDASLSILTLSTDSENTDADRRANTTHQMGGLNVTSPVEDSPVTRNAKTFVGAHHHVDSLESFRKRTTSLPIPRKLILDGNLKDVNRSKSCGELLD